MFGTVRDTPWIKHRSVWFMDTTQGGVLVYQLDQTEVFMSDHASPTVCVIPSDHSIHADHNFPLDRADQTIRTDLSDHPDRTTRVLYRIDPHTSGLKLSMEPLPRDGFDRPNSLLSQTIQHSKTDCQTRFILEREESEDVHRFSLMALLVRPACPEGGPDVLSSVPDPLMDFYHPYFTKTWKLSCLTPLSFLGVVSSKLNASFLLDRCVTSGNRSSLLPCRTCESYQATIKHSGSIIGPSTTLCVTIHPISSPSSRIESISFFTGRVFVP
ncbi:hypothetical protein YC2023_071565 [Brassica napus]